MHSPSCFYIVLNPKLISLPLQTFPPSYGLDEWLISLLVVVLGVSREVLLVVGVAKFIATVVPSAGVAPDRDGMMVSGGQVPVL